ncbi:hypothetical protein Lal_00038568 [Lupinus albus]|uniref:Putative alpha/Beta hydrolase n=1 Tax=Lupinus albus TaxID=3870 RepID=A0A6A4NXS2_LUPAL|nr:putative alpha/Beta hydrolase [Lupinus albus]KAF1881924.1 hypothetical protein Lal_00038568 [Lupinus albus]
MATISLIHARCVYAPPIANRRNCTKQGLICFFSSSSTSNSVLSFSFDRNEGQRYWNLRVRSQVMTTTTEGNSIATTASNLNNDPDHLLVLVHGISGSPSDWTYAEGELKRQLGKNFLVYASASNAYSMTFTGIDESGRRLADEVRQVVKQTRSLKRISFLAHSLGGLFARYAVAVLYSPDTCNSDQHVDTDNSIMESSQRTTNFSNGGMIAGLEPINFITLATPHLGVRGKKQLPFLLGIQFLEKLAAPLAPYFVGRTGAQLFLTDGEPNNPSLLLRMASDCEDEKFLSALGAFRCRVVYANVSYDHMVGWRTSSIRRESELGKPPSKSLDGYRHVVNVQYSPPVLSDGPQFPPEAMKAKETAQNTHDTQNTAEYHEIMEEEMIRGLQQLGWKKVDVSFHTAFWPFFAHNNINVKYEFLHNAGAGVITHVADSIRQQETASVLAGSF